MLIYSIKFKKYSTNQSGLIILTLVSPISSSSSLIITSLALSNTSMAPPGRAQNSSFLLF